ncbi:MAG: recombination mediator RecR [Candidatus Cloacimonetes bacterium]|nr:recombination mediator RecR [Candidatus Cloacimonadota bacterium]
MFKGVLAELQKNLRLLPGVGEKTAQRLAMHLITQEKELSLRLAESISAAVNAMKKCSVCHILTEVDPCIYCSDYKRDQTKICVVENSQDVYLIDNTHEYNGRYFVLGGLISPLDGISPKDIFIHELLETINSGEIEEVILALNPSAEGESTINYLAAALKKYMVKVTRLSTGIPFGGDIGYSSPVTLSNAFKRRFSV